MKKQERKIFIGLLEKASYLLDQPDSKENSLKILKVCDALDKAVGKKPVFNPEQLDIWVQGDTIYVK